MINLPRGGQKVLSYSGLDGMVRANGCFFRFRCMKGQGFHKLTAYKGKGNFEVQLEHKMNKKY